MKKRSKAIILFLSILLVIFTLTSCINKNSFKKSGYFTYTYDYNDSKFYSIAGLTEEGEQQETLVFPSQINGRKVNRIGVYEPLTFADATYRIVHFFESEKLKTIYFPKGYTRTMLHKNFYTNLKNVECVYWGDYNLSEWLLFSTNVNIYVSSQFLKHQDSKEIYKDGFFNMFPRFHLANVEYYMNDGSEDVYFVDHVSGTKVNVEPSIPYREGYTFRGWYKDKELTTLWDFENDIIPEIKLDEEGNEIIDVTKIYAGWDLKNEK